jgi:hypothetical protein
LTFGRYGFPSAQRVAADVTYLQNMMVVCKDRLDTIKSRERIGAEAAVAVESDINALLSGKSYDDLVSLQRRIQEKLTGGEPVDTDYWEGLLKKLLVWKAKVTKICNSNWDGLSTLLTGEVEDSP